MVNFLLQVDFAKGCPGSLYNIIYGYDSRINQYLNGHSEKCLKLAMWPGIIQSFSDPSSIKKL